MTTTLRSMQDADLEAVHEIECQIFSVPWSISTFAKDLMSDKTNYIVALSDGRIVGYAGLWKMFDEGHINNIGVHPDYWRQGIGEQLLLELLVRGRKMGILNFTLEVRASNTGAIKLYEKCGFVSVGERKNYYIEPNENAVIMWLYEQVQ